MASALPLRPSVEHTPRSSSSVVLGDDDSTAVLQALGSDTARGILAALSDGPATASEIAEATGTSQQNAHYHLKNLLEAGLITDAGTWYSSKGREMTVYAVTSERVELRLTSESTADPEQETDAAGPSPRHPRLTGD